MPLKSPPDQADDIFDLFFDFHIKNKDRLRRCQYGIPRQIETNASRSSSEIPFSGTLFDTLNKHFFTGLKKRAKIIAK
jgi:hypothetical protein